MTESVGWGQQDLRLSPDTEELPRKDDRKAGKSPVVEQLWLRKYYSLESL